MTKQTKNLIALGVLVVLTGISYQINIASKRTTATAAIKALAAAKAVQQESPLMARFHRVRAEMDGLYHYRTKPVPFDTTDNPFRIPEGVDFSDEKAPPVSPSKKPAADAPAAPNAPPEFGDGLLTHAIALTRLGGVVTMNDTTQLTVNGELHKQGDVFTVKVQNRLVLIRIKLLTTAFVTLALDDPASGTAELRVRLK
jgi:hypothetical protein